MFQLGIALAVSHESMTRSRETAESERRTAMVTVGCPKP